MKKLVVGFDGSDQARDALQLAEVLRASAGGEMLITVVDEVDPLLSDVRALDQTRDEFFESMFEAASAELGHSDFTRRTAADSVPAALDHIAEADEADAIVVGSTHRGKLGRVLPGSIGDRLLAGSPCAVVVAPGGYRDRERPSVALVGIGYDGQHESKAALEEAVDLARSFDATLRIITVEPTLAQLAPERGGHVNPGYTRALHDHFAEQLEEAVSSCRGRVDVESALKEGDPGATLADQTVELDLLVLGSRGYGPVRRVLLGGVASKVMSLAACPVVVTPKSAKHHRAESDAEDAAEPALN